MFDRFGPWSSALGNDAPTHRLDTFWKRRLTLLATTRSARQTPRRRDWCLLTLAAVAVLVVPTLHLATAQEKSPARPADPGTIYVRANFSPPDRHDDALSGLFAIDPVTAERTRLADDFFFGLRVSPDGWTVALERGGWLAGKKSPADAGLWTLATDGKGEKRKIRDFGGMTSWSPDGEELIVSHVTAPTEDGRGVKSHETWRLKSDGSGATKLPIPDSEGVQDWSPDGQWIVTVSSRQAPKFPNYQLYVMHLDGTGERLISDGTGGNVYPRFSPDGQQVAYLHWVNDDASIQVVNVDGTGRRILVRDDPTTSHDNLSWSPDGKTIVVRVRTPEIDPTDGHKRHVAGQGNPRLLVINVDGSGSRTIPTPTARWLESPDWR